MTHPPDLANLRPVSRHAPLTTLRVVLALILREMTTSYGRSPGGYVWAVLEPVAAIALLTWVFSLIIKEPPLGTNFAMFYATGWLPFHVFQVVNQKTAQSLSYSRQLLAYPRVTILDALLARYLLNLMLQLLVSGLILTGIRLLYETGTKMALDSILLGFAMAAALAGGIGLLNCYLFSRFPVWQNVWSILMRPIVLVSGVMLLIESVPKPWSDYLTWNPIVHLVAEVRHGFYHSYHAAYVAPAFVFGVSLVTGAIGLLFVWRYHRDISEM